MFNHYRHKMFFLAMLYGFTLLSPVTGRAENSALLEELQNAFIHVSKDVQPSVVNISTVQKIKAPEREMRKSPFHGSPFEEYFDDFFKNMPENLEQQSLGSGVIIDEKGYILTNNHVIEKADTITVRLSDKTKFSGVVLGKDPKTDLAVIKIDPGEITLKAAKLGNSDLCQIGQWAIAIGNPFGLDHTVTIGVISATGRSNIGITKYEDYLQTDASINPGNSGGPLINLKGEVVGINTAIVAAGQGIGFAVPVNMAKQIKEQLIEHGRVVRGWMGIAIQDITEDLAKQFAVKEGEGVLVGQVFKDDPADKAGVKVGDVVVEFNATKVTNPAQLSRLAASVAPNKKADLVIIRDGKRKTLEITMGEQKEEKAEGQISNNGSYGFKVDEITPKMIEEFGISQKEGVVITEITPGGNAAKAGLRPGDIIVEINRQRINNLADYHRVMASIGNGESLVVLRVRNQSSLYVGVEGK